MKKVKPPPLSPYLDERELQINADYEWGLQNQELQKKYGGKIVVIYKRKVWGVGRNHLEAWKDAERKRGCPPKGVSALVVMPYYFQQVIP